MRDVRAENQALRALKDTDDVEDFLARVVEFWASEEKVLVELYGVAAVDPAARDLVERQRRDRHAVARRLVGGMRLRAGCGRRTRSYTWRCSAASRPYLELRRHTALAKRDVVEALLRSARGVLAPA